MSGITLIEVLVGFVIFMASLVAILDYVANQMHLRRTSAENLERASALYQQALRADYPEDIAAGMSALPRGVTVEKQTERLLDSYSYRREKIGLWQVDYRAQSASGVFQWSVIEVR